MTPQLDSPGDAASDALLESLDAVGIVADAVDRESPRTVPEYTRAARAAAE